MNERQCYHQDKYEPKSRTWNAWNISAVGCYKLENREIDFTEVWGEELERKRKNTPQKSLFPKRTDMYRKLIFCYLHFYGSFMVEMYNTFHVKSNIGFLRALASYGSVFSAWLLDCKCRCSVWSNLETALEMAYFIERVGPGPLTTSTARS